MRQIILNKMRIKKFKGIQNLEIDFDGTNTLISGFNGVGKSTIADAYFWAITGKNTALDAKFEVRPRDKQGNEVHDVITAVECSFKVDDVEFTVRREELENLTKKQRAELTPETIAPKKSYYFIDGAPYEARVFQDKIAELMCGADRFTLISNPFAFFALKESEQRELLTAACGDVADSDIDGYDKVKEICGAVNTPIQVKDGLKKSILATQKRLNEIPARVDSLAQNCDEYADYETQIAELEKQKSEAEEKGKEIKEKFAAKTATKTITVQEPSKREILDYEYQIKDIECDIESDKRLLEIIERSIEQNTCPKCGYDMGSRANEKPLCEKSIADKQKQLLVYRESLQQAQAEYDKAMQEYNAKVAEQAQADEVTERERQTLETQLQDCRQRYTDLSVQINALQNKQNIQEQIKALRAEQRQLDDKLADDMTKLNIITAFILKKAEKVVENINGHFTAIKFKLFEMQTNGELKTCCKATVNGVSYANLNTATKVQVGIEIIKLLSSFYDTKAVVWVDNRESVIELPELDAQTVCLKVDERYKEIHIEAV